MFIQYVLIENRHSVKNPSVEICFRDSLLYCQVTKYINPPLVLRIFMEKKKKKHLRQLYQQLHILKCMM